MLNNFERVLSDVELTIAINDGCTADLFALAERVEQAVLAKLAEQEPVVYRFLPPDTQQYMYITDDVPKIKEFEPLYAHPPMLTDHIPDAKKIIEQDADKVDAGRYRWLRDPKNDVALVLDKRTGYVPEDEQIPGVGGYHTYEYRAGVELDAAIDAARGQCQGRDTETADCDNQEPVAWRITARVFCGEFTSDPEIAKYWLETEPESVTPLYAHPMPYVSPTSDKPACVSESAESDTQHHLECIKRYQKWRRGEDKTMSEMGLTPKQIGEALDWLIGVAENHIADASKMVCSDHIADMRKKVPEGWQLIPKEPTMDMIKALLETIVTTSKGGVVNPKTTLTYALAAAPKYTGEK